ncbi:adenylate kinase [Paenibacillus sp. FSL R7-0128]|uniref:adenylate kinase n=1 Tax=Paenibacillus sp. FSL R7-0128 TaxID=2954529 RepID=UPI0030F58FF2
MTKRTLPNVGLTGRLRSGKDTVGDYLASKYGYTQFAFGDALKRYAHEIFGHPAPGTKPRELYQWFGQTMRQRDPDVWVRKCLVNIDAHRAHSNAVRGPGEFRAVITDTRQPNEYEALSARSYVLIRVEASDGLRIQRAVESGDTFAYTDLAHGTETALDGYAANFTVTNDAGLAELHAQIDEIMSYLGGEWPE